MRYGLAAVSDVIAELVMDYIGTKSLATFPTKPRRWYRYVDDSNACLKRSQVADFHTHLNSINDHIQFTIEHPTEIEERQSISFLDYKIAAKPGYPVEITVYRKVTHTNKYLDFNSHNPLQHKATIVNTLLHRAREFPFNEKLQKQEVEKVCSEPRSTGIIGNLSKKYRRNSKKTQKRRRNPNALRFYRKWREYQSALNGL